MLLRTTRTKPWRRLAAALSAAALGVGLLAGCGSDSDDPADEAGGGTPAAAGAFPVTVEHAFGTTKIDKAPERVVSVGYTDDQTVLAFGIKPVGMVDQYPNPAGQSPDINTQWPWVKDKWGDTKPEVVMKNGDTGPNFEKIAALRPDLIVAVYSEIDQAAYDKLSKIAPTVGRTKGEKEPFSAPWQDNALHIAKALGKAEEGEKMVADIQGKLDAAKQAHPEFADKTAVVLSWYKDSVAPFTSTDVRGRLVTGIGFKYETEIDKVAGGDFYALARTRRPGRRGPCLRHQRQGGPGRVEEVRAVHQPGRRQERQGVVPAGQRGPGGRRGHLPGHPAVHAVRRRRTRQVGRVGVSATDTRVATAPAVLRTATGGESGRWVAAHCREVPWLTAATVLTTVAGAALQVLPVLLLGRVVDAVAGGESQDVLVTIGILMVAAALLGAVATAVSTCLIGRLGADLLARLREGAVRAVLAMPSARVEQVGRGDVLSRVGDDVAVISKGIRTAVPTVFSAGVLVAIATAGMFGLDWRLGLAGAGALPAYALALRWYLPRSAPLYRKQRVAQADRAQALISGLNGIDTVRAYRLEGAFRERVTRESWRVRELGIEVFRFFGRFVGRENRAEFIGLTLIIVVGYALLEADAATLGEVSAAPLLFHRLFTPWAPSCSPSTRRRSRARA